MIEAHWASKNIHSLYKGWFVNMSVVLTRIDLSNNYLQELPDELFTSLCVLEELDVSNNNLLCLPDINFGDCPTRYTQGVGAGGAYPQNIQNSHLTTTFPVQWFLSWVSHSYKYHSPGFNTYLLKWQHFLCFHLYVKARAIKMDLFPLPLSNIHVYFYSFSSLEKLFLQRNQLSFVPSSLFRIKTLSKVNLSYNTIRTLDDEESLDMGDTWRCPALKVLKLSNNILTCLPRGIQSATGLVKLFVNNNKLKDFPMPWKCPLVR